MLWKGNLPFLLCVTLYSRANSEYKPPGGLIFGGAYWRFFLSYDFGGLIFVGAYTWRGLFSEFYGMLLNYAFLYFVWSALMPPIFY